MALFILMLKIITPSISNQPDYTRINENKLNIDDSASISIGKINDKIAILSNNIKEISFRIGFLTSKASLIFT